MSKSQTRVLFSVNGSLVGEGRGQKEREGKEKGFLTSPGPQETHATFTLIFLG